jgi:2'-5' RNA ligase
MRLFIAINLSEQIKDSLCETIAELRGAAKRGRYTWRENLHLTLVFIGETNRADDVLDIMEEVAEERFTEPMELTLTAPGVFGGRGGDLHWVGVENTPELKALAKSLASGLQEGGFSIEKHRFTPHITIAREVMIARDVETAPSAITTDASAESGRLAAPRIKTGAGSMTVDHISLMRSDRKDGLLVYTEIGAVYCQTYDRM